MTVPESTKIKQKNGMINEFRGGNSRQEIRSFYSILD